MASGRPLHTRLAVTAGYATAALVIAAVSPALARHPVRNAALTASRHVATARSGLDLWLEVRSTPPPTLTELAIEALLGGYANRSQGPSATTTAS